MAGMARFECLANLAQPVQVVDVVRLGWYLDNGNQGMGGGEVLGDPPLCGGLLHQVGMQP